VNPVPFSHVSRRWSLLSRV